MNSQDKPTQPKKRGRKPKVKPVEEKKEPKKRGRKPKNNIIVKENPEFDGKYDQDIIVKLDKVSVKPDVHLDSDENVQFQSITQTNEAKKSSICWNCSYPLSGFIVGMPVEYKDDIFYTYGDFCCDSCSLRYAYDNYCDSTYYKVLSNIHLKYKLQKRDTTVHLPLSKYTLDIYGGPLQREDYIQGKETINIQLSNCIHMNHVFSKNDKKTHNTTQLQSDLKLYRKNNNLYKNDINKLLNMDKI